MEYLTSISPNGKLLGQFVDELMSRGYEWLLAPSTKSLTRSYYTKPESGILMRVPPPPKNISLYKESYEKGETMASGLTHAVAYNPLIGKDHVLVVAAKFDKDIFDVGLVDAFDGISKKKDQAIRLAGYDKDYLTRIFRRYEFMGKIRQSHAPALIL